MKSQILILMLIGQIMISNCDSSMESGGDTDFFDQNYADALIKEDEFLDPEADNPPLNRNARSLLAYGESRRRLKAGAADDGDRNRLINGDDCMFIYVEAANVTITKYREVKGQDPSKPVTYVAEDGYPYRYPVAEITKSEVIGKVTCLPKIPSKTTSEGRISIKLSLDRFYIMLDLSIKQYTHRYWELTKKSNMTIMDKSGSEVKFNISNYDELTAGTQFSFSCQSLELTSGRFENHPNLADARIVLKRFQMQPYPPKMDKFKAGMKKGKIFLDSFDCATWFTVPLWTGFLVVLFFTFILATGIVALLDIKTMDRFENPKGKTITVTAATD